MILLVGFAAQAACTDPTSYFCYLMPHRCDVVVTAELVSLEDGTASLRLLEEAHYDPDGITYDGQLIEGLKCTLQDAKTGWVGIFRVHPPGACVEVYPDEHTVIHAVFEEDGVYHCDEASAFQGAAHFQIIDAIFSEDCHQAIAELGLDTECGETGGCCGGTAACMEDGLLLAMSAMGLVWMPRRKRKREK